MHLAKKSLILFLIIAIQHSNCFGAYQFNDQIVFGRLMGLWNNLLEDQNTSEENRIIVKKDIYSFIFQCWMVNQYHGTYVLSKGQVLAVVRVTSSAVNKNDPMGIDLFYDGDDLNDFGKSRLDQEFLVEADVLLSSKQRYHAFVSRFLKWIADLKNSKS